MRSVKQSIGAYGAASAIFSGAIACAFVAGASIFGPQLAALVSDLACDAAPDCAAPAALAAPAPPDPVEQLSAELPTAEEAPAALMPTFATPTTAMHTTR
jgi:hypothetical protein